MREFFGPDFTEIKFKSNRRGKNKKVQDPNLIKLMGEANELYASGQHELAIIKLFEITNLNREFSPPYHTLGLIFEEKNQMPMACNYYLIAAELSGKNPTLWKRLASMFLAIDDKQNSLYCYNKAIKQNSTDLNSFIERADLLNQMGFKKKAISDLIHYLSKNHYNLEIYKELSTLYEQIGDDQQALEILAKGYQTMSQDPNFNINQQKEKKRKFEFTQNVDFELIDMYSNLLLKVSDFKQVLSIIDFADMKRSMTPLPLELVCKYTICHIHLDQLTLVQNQIDFLLSQPVEKWFELYRQVANSLLSTLNYNLAIVFFENLRQVVSCDNPDLWIPLAKAYHSLKNYEKSLYFYHLSFEYDKSNVEICLRLSSIYDEIGETEKAISVVGECSELLSIQKDDLEPIEEKQIELNQIENMNELLPPNTNISIENYNSPVFDSQQPCNFDLKEKKIRVLLQKGHLLFVKGDYKEFVEILSSIFKDKNLLFYRDRKRSYKKQDVFGDMEDEHLEDHLDELDWERIYKDENEQEVKKVKKKRKRRKSLKIFDFKSFNQKLITPEPIESLQNYQPIASNLYYSKNIWELLGMQNFISLFNNYLKCVSYLGKDNVESDCYYNLFYVYEFIMGENEFSKIDVFDQMQLRFLVSRVAYTLGYYEYTIRLIRNVCTEFQDNIIAWNLFFKAASKIRKFTVSRRLVMRLRQKNPNSLPLIVLNAHMSEMAGSHKYALNDYLAALSIYPNHPLLLLSTGVAFINISMSRTTADRHSVLLKGFSYIHRYFVEHIYGNGQCIQEAYYNFARAFHQVMLYNFAIPLYEFVLKDESMIEGNPNMVGNLKREAAYNLAMIYTSTGSNHLARKLLQEFVSI